MAVCVFSLLCCKGIFFEREPKRFGFEKSFGVNDALENDNYAQVLNKKNETKILLATGKWPPYSSEDMKNYGIASEIITAVFNKMGIDTEYNFYPWKRCELLVQEGNIFATFPYSRTEERMEKYLFAKDYIIYDNTVLFYHRKHNTKENFNFNKIEDLANYSVIGLSGYHYLEKFKKAGTYEKLDITDGETTAFQKLIAGRNELLPLSEAVGWEIIKSEFPDELNNFDTLDKTLVTAGFGLMVSKSYPNSKALLERFNHSFDTLIENGEYQKILAKYNVSLPEHLKEQKQNDDKILLVTGEWPPFTTQHSEEQGFITEIITAVFKEMGRVPEYRFYPWSRCELLVKEGKAFGAFPYSKNEERQEIYDFSDPIINAKDKFFFYKKYHNKEDFNYNEFVDLKSFGIAGIAGYYYIEIFNNAGLSDNLDYTDNEILALKKLVSGRVDLVPLNELNALHLIKENFPQEAGNFDSLDKSITQNKLHIIASRKYPKSEKLLDHFNKALRLIKENGLYGKILNKYGLSSNN